MATSLAKIPGLNVSAIDVNKLAGLNQNALGAGGAAPGASRGVQYASFNGNTGVFGWGRAGTPIPDDQVFIVSVQSLRHGWTYWEGKKSEKDTLVMVPGFDQLPPKPDNRPLQGTMPPPKNRDGWSATYEMRLHGVDGTLDGFELDFQHSSVSYKHFWGDLGAAVFAASQEVEGNTFIHPVITIGVGSYQHGDYDKTVYTIDHQLIGFSDGNTIQYLEDKADGAPTAVDDDDDDVLG